MSVPSIYATYEQLEENADKALDDLVIQIKDTEHKNKLLSKYPLLLVDVYADWCEPCKMIADEYKAMAQKYNLPSQCAFAKENVDLRLTPSVTGIPTFILYRNGKPVEQMVGANSLKPMEDKVRLHHKNLSPSFQQTNSDQNPDRMSPQISKVIRQYRQQAPVVESNYNPVVSGSHVGYATYNAPVPSRR